MADKAAGKEAKRRAEDEARRKALEDRRAEVNALLGKGSAGEALAVALENPPLLSSDGQLKVTITAHYYSHSKHKLILLVILIGIFFLMYVIWSTVAIFLLLLLPG